MPLISYPCSCGQVIKKYFKSAKDAATLITCVCGLEAKRGFGSISSSHKITIDNGLMAKSIEVDPNIMEINDERSQKNYTEED
jgi:hypothetical protein